MTKIIIFQTPNVPDYTRQLINWAKLFRIDYEVKTDYPINTVHDCEFNLLITSDLFPKNVILSHFMQEKESSSVLKVKEIDGKPYPSFCILTSKSDENPKNLTFYSENDITNDLTTKPSHIFNSSNFDYGNLMWDLIISEFYIKDNYHVTRFYYPLWIEANHKYFLNKEKMGNFNWFKDQTCFCTSIPKIFEKERISYAKFKDLIRNDKLTFQRCKDGLKRHVYEVEISKNELKNHPLSIPLVYECIPVGENEKIDMSKTVVTFLYDLSRNDRPMTGYMKSLEKFAKLRYPIVFFCDSKEICSQFIKYRGILSVYTEVIIKKLDDWEVFQKYPSIKEELNLDRMKSDRYKKLTVLKFWALSESIDKNVFPSDNYVWMDAGLYKYDELPYKFKDETYLFKNINSPDDKIIVESLSQGCGTTNEEYEKGIENILAAIIIGGKKGWKDVLPLLKNFVNSKYEEGSIQSEQKIMSRFDTLYPDFFIRRYAGYNSMTLVHFLNL